MELTKTRDVETLGKLIYGTIDKDVFDKIKYDAYRYLLILMKAVVGLNYYQNDE